MFDVFIVGAGPIGLEMAAAVKEAGLSHAHIERGRIGQTIFQYPPDTRFFSSPERIAIAGVPLLTLDQSKATREEYLTYLRAVALQLDLKVNLFEGLERIERTPDGFEISTRHIYRLTQNKYRARRVVLACGDMHKPRKLGIPGEDSPHVSHYLGDPHTYFLQNVLIAGGRNSAAEAALRLNRAGARVTLSYRREELPAKSIKYWIYPELQSLIQSGTVRFLPSSQVEEIAGEHVLVRTPGGELREPFDFVLLLTGYESDPSLFHACGVSTETGTHRPVWNSDTMETNVPGLYVAGTGAAGTQKPFELFIENCHEHVDKIISSITGKERTSFRRYYQLPES